MRRRTNLATVLLLVAIGLFVASACTATWHWQHVNYYVCVALGLAAVAAAALLDGWLA